MGQLYPPNFQLDTLRNDAERTVVVGMLEQLTDNWIVAPHVCLQTRDRDHELDIVVAHPADGIGVIEVKGHVPTVDNGIWVSEGEPMRPQPIQQARDNAYALRGHVRTAHPSLHHLDIAYGVAFPNASGINGTLPPDVDSAQIITGDHLTSLRDAVDCLMTYRYTNHRLGEVGLDRLLDVVCPSATFDRAADVRNRLARARLDQRSRHHIAALASLDLNRRVCVTGAAGSGKTRLVSRWAGRAVLRGDRTLVTCFNLPLGDQLRSQLTETDLLRIAPFFEFALALPIVGIEQPDITDSQWWEHTLIDHLAQRWHELEASGIRYDTIIVDEAQDFAPRWIELLEQLLAPNGRLLLVADPSQGIYERGFTVPDEATWTRCELTRNCRNTRDISQLLEQRFSGADTVDSAPDSETIEYVEADHLDAIVDEVGETIDDLLVDRDHAAVNICVGTFSSALRDELRRRLAMVDWEGRTPETILCENVHRVKGLEFDHVVLVSDSERVDDPTDELLYVGASRPTHSLTVIGPAPFLDRLR